MEYWIWYTIGMEIIMVIGVLYYAFQGTAVTIFTMEEDDKKDGVVRLRPATNDRAVKDKNSKGNLKLRRTKKPIPRFIKGVIPHRLPFGIIRERIYLATPDWENFYPLDFGLLGSPEKLGIYPEPVGAIQFNANYNRIVAQRQMKTQQIMQIMILGSAIAMIAVLFIGIKITMGQFTEMADVFTKAASTLSGGGQRGAALLTEVTPP